MHVSNAEGNRLRLLWMLHHLGWIGYERVSVRTVKMHLVLLRSDSIRSKGLVSSGFVLNVSQYTCIVSPEG